MDDHCERGRRRRDHTLSPNRYFAPLQALRLLQSNSMLPAVGTFQRRVSMPVPYGIHVLDNEFGDDYQFLFLDNPAARSQTARKPTAFHLHPQSYLFHKWRRGERKDCMESSIECISTIDGVDEDEISTSKWDNRKELIWLILAQTEELLWPTLCNLRCLGNDNLLIVLSNGGCRAALQTLDEQSSSHRRNLNVPQPKIHHVVVTKRVQS
ncbi:sulfate anion transporter 1, partial [Striga asiatica]